MFKRSRCHLLMLALMVAVSHVALISHVTAHFRPALEQCELCVSQAHPLAAIPVAEPVTFLASAITLNWPEPAARPRAAAAAHPYFQRAPPVPSS
jgi:hypothetical protein